MGAPGENYKGYVEADATQRARNVPSHSMYLLHGLADITAPYQHGVALARALAEAGIIFRYQVSFLQAVFFIAELTQHRTDGGTIGRYAATMTPALQRAFRQDITRR